MTTTSPRTDPPKRAGSPRRRPLLFTGIMSPLGAEPVDAPDDAPAKPKKKFELKRRPALGLPALVPIAPNHGGPPPLKPMQAVVVRRAVPLRDEPARHPNSINLPAVIESATMAPPRRLGPKSLRMGGRVFVASLGAMGLMFGSEWLVAGSAAAFPPRAAVWADTTDDGVRVAEPRTLADDAATEPPSPGSRFDNADALFTLASTAAGAVPVPRARPAERANVRRTEAPTGRPVPRANPRRVTVVPSDDAEILTLGSSAPFATGVVEPQSQPSLTPVQPIASIPPYRFMRMMSALQDDIARGSQQALEAQAALTRRSNEVFAGASAETWEDPRNVRALLQHALAGAEPEVVAGALRQVPEDAPWQSLLQGALAYTEGRQADALRRLEAQNLLDVDPGVRGSLHLALAALTVGRDPDEALAHLADARAVAPGSLVEEASLRRGILIAGETDNADLLLTLTDRYLRKFSRSIYAGNFRQRLASALTRMSFIRDLDGFDRLDTLLAGLSPGARTEQYLLIARTALEFGEPIAAAAAAKRAVADAAPESPDRVRANLYEAAALVVDAQNSERARQTLAEIDPEPLPAADAALRIAALRVGEGVATVPDAPPASSVPAELTSPEEFIAITSGPNRTGEVDPNDPFSEPVELLSTIFDELSATDDLLEQFQ